MSEAGWLSVPLGIDAPRWVTRADCRTVLVVVHTVATAHRLLDVMGEIEQDRRIQVIFTQAPDVFGTGVSEFLRAIGALCVPWQQAVRERFALVLAAAYGGIHELHGPVMVLPYGTGRGRRMSATVATGRSSVCDLDAARLVRDGRVVPASIVLSHSAQRRVLLRQCPEALPMSVVAGDPCYDRLQVSTMARDAYRAALGVGPDQRLVVLASTWGTRSLFARYIELLPELVDRLSPRRYRVALLVHAATWFGHGPRQIRAWLADARAAGLTVIGPTVDWRVAVLAADHVIGDHGSTSVYAAAIGVPVLHADPTVVDIAPQSAQSWLGANAAVFDPAVAIEPQLDQATAAAKRTTTEVAERLTSCPGEAHRILRDEMYRLLGIPVRGRHREVEPVPLPGTGVIGDE